MSLSELFVGVIDVKHVQTFAFQSARGVMPIPPQLVARGVLDMMRVLIRTTGSASGRFGTWWPPAAEHRRVMVTAARVAVGQLHAMLPEPTPQRGLAGFGQRVKRQVRESERLWHSTGPG